MEDHNHENPELCDVCSGRMTLEEREEKERGFLKTIGWYCHIIMDADDSPTGFDFHTHGFEDTVDHPDIQIILPIDIKICHSLAAGIYDEIKNGRHIKVQEKNSGIVSNLDVMFIKVQECDREVLRLILPDEDGHLLARDMTADPPDYALQWTV